MTKKKSGKVDKQDKNFQPPKSMNSVYPKGRAIERSDKKSKQGKKEVPKSCNPTNSRTQDRKAQQQKYKQNLVLRKIQQQKKPYQDLTYFPDSQAGQLDQQSAQRRVHCKTIQQIRQMLQQQQINQNTLLLSIEAENQFEKVQMLGELIDEANRDGEGPCGDRERDIGTGLFFAKDRLEGEDHVPGRSIVDRIGELEQIYY